ncbi:hypothetical protein V9T40_011915 [Parthenolecanium corni]|uniref:Uncharacterized protein n=1 Tax=Parthenolecanium corni TaxID=536013 RepID=A0AAN9XZ01_9HEMI
MNGLELLNLRFIADSGELPETFCRSLAGESFSILNSLDEGRVIEHICNSPKIWYCYVEVISGLDSDDEITVRLANAVLSSKDLLQYQFVLRAMKNVAEEYRKSTCYPGHIMADFKWPSLMPVWRLR